jgi:hypothetical protein
MGKILLQLAIAGEKVTLRQLLNGSLGRGSRRLLVDEFIN